MLALGLVEHQEVAAVHHLEHFVYLEEGQVLVDLVAASRIFEVVLPASFLDNDVHKDPFVVAAGLDRADALGVAFREGDLDEGDISVDEDAFVNDVLEYAAEVEVGHALGA